MNRAAIEKGGGGIQSSFPYLKIIKIAGRDLVVELLHVVPRSVADADEHDRQGVGAESLRELARLSTSTTAESDCETEHTSPSQSSRSSSFLAD